MVQENSFGLTFDPVSGHLWTGKMEERMMKLTQLNLVSIVDGESQRKSLPPEAFHQDEFVDFGGKENTATQSLARHQIRLQNCLRR